MPEVPGIFFFFYYTVQGEESLWSKCVIFKNIYQFLFYIVQINLILMYKVKKIVKWLAFLNKALFPAQINTLSSSILRWHRAKYTKNCVTVT